MKNILFTWEQILHFYLGNIINTLSLLKKKFKNFILPIHNFKKSGFLLPNKISPKNIKSIGIVAFGRDHKAELIVKEINFTK